jgi:predicted nucleic acid-binding protein
MNLQQNFMQPKNDMPQEILIDTNVLLRIILKDDPKQLAQITDLLEQAEAGKVNLYCKTISIFEIIFVLSGKIYELEKVEVVEIMQTLLNISVISFEKIEILNESLNIYLENNISFPDSFLIATCTLENLDFYSFDQKANKVYKKLTLK